MTCQVISQIFNRPEPPYSLFIASSFLMVPDLVLSAFFLVLFNVKVIATINTIEIKKESHLSLWKITIEMVIKNKIIANDIQQLRV